jgi:hypothetical protein
VSNTEAPNRNIQNVGLHDMVAVDAAGSRVQGTSKATTQWLLLLENAGERVAAHGDGRGLVWVVSGLMHDEPVRPRPDARYPLAANRAMGGLDSWLYLAVVIRQLRNPHEVFG